MISAKLSLTQKDSPSATVARKPISNTKNVRKEFRTLAFWQGSLKTGNDGKVTFEFTAPDNLTTYRIVAVGQTKANQFGGDSTQTVKDIETAPHRSSVAAFFARRR